MGNRLECSIRALAPFMTRAQAEGFLHVTAFVQRKSLETLSAEDWPAVERAVREAVQHTAAEQRLDLILERLRAAYLEDCDLEPQ